MPPFEPAVPNGHFRRERLFLIASVVAGVLKRLCGFATGGLIVSHVVV